jgi:hypothetical protein
MQKKVKNTSKSLERFPKMLRKRKPFRLLATMTKKEIVAFRHFLISPLSNPKVDQQLVKFFDDCMRLCIWECEMDKERFSEKTGQNFTDNVLNKLVSRLYDQLGIYGSLMEFLKSKPDQAQFTVLYFKNKGLEYDELDKKVKENKRDLDHVNQNANYFRLMLELDLETAQKAESRNKSPQERGLGSLHSHLDNYYLILKLRFLCASLNEARIFGNSEEVPPSEILMPWIKLQYPTMPLLAKAYFHIYHILVETGTDEHVQVLLSLLQTWKTSGPRSSDEEYSEVNRYLINYYVQRLNSDELDLDQAHEFYMEKLEQGLLSDAGKLRYEHFKNIISLNCRIGRIQEARQFFEAFKPQLPEAIAAIAISYNDAILELYEKKYLSAISKLEILIEATGAIKDDKFYGLDVRCNALKAYYEFLQIADLEDWDRTDQKLHSLLRAFIPFIQRKKDMRPISRVRFENFAKMVQRLYTIRFDEGVDRRIKLEELLLDLKSSSNLPHRIWFLNQVRML